MREVAAAAQAGRAGPCLSLGVIVLRGAPDAVTLPGPGLDRALAGAVSCRGDVGALCELAELAAEAATCFPLPGPREGLTALLRFPRLRQGPTAAASSLSSGLAARPQGAAKEPALARVS